MKVGSVVIDCNDLAGMRAFWKDALAYDVDYESDDWIKLSDPNEKGVSVSLQLVPEPREGKNRLHLDLYARDQWGEVARLEGLGATRHRDMGSFWQMLDPAGLVFCVVGIQTGDAFDRYATTWP